MQKLPQHICRSNGLLYNTAVQVNELLNYVNLLSGVVECLKVVTAEKSRRIAKFAFDYATKHGRKRVCTYFKFYEFYNFIAICKPLVNLPPKKVFCHLFFGKNLFLVG